MDFFSSSSSSSSLQEDLMHADMLFWGISPESFDLVSTAPYLLATPSEPPPAVVPHSAFVRYVRPEAHCSSSWISNERNIHRRVNGFLRRIPRGRRSENTATVGGSPEYTRGFRHMMRERQRRERLSQSYADLHSMLPYRSKADKNSIMQSAAVYVRELEGVKEELVRRNEELRLRAARNSNLQRPKIIIRAENPASAIDSMIGALQRLKAMDANAMAIQTAFYGQSSQQVMTIEYSKVGASEVERALMAKLEIEEEMRKNK